MRGNNNTIREKLYKNRKESLGIDFLGMIAYVLNIWHKKKRLCLVRQHETEPDHAICLGDPNGFHDFTTCCYTFPRDLPPS